MTRLPSINATFRRSCGLTVALAIFLAPLMVLTACESTPKNNNSLNRSNSTGNSRTASSQKIQSTTLGQAVEPIIPEDDFANRINRLAAQQDEFNLRLLLDRYPDAARDLVVSTHAQNKSAARIAASWLDQQAAPERGGWVLLIDDRRANPSRYQSYDQQKQAMLQMRSQGRFDAMMQAPLTAPADAPSPWLNVDALTLKATAAMVSGQPDQAATGFVQAAELAGPWDDQQARKLRLFAALAYQAAGDYSAAETQRQAGLQGLDVSRVKDPMLLQLAIHTDERGQGFGSISSAGLPSLRVLKARLGALLMKRGTPQAALLQWRAAESEPGTQPSNAILRLRQAEALIALNQTESAKALLIGLAGENSTVRPEALTMLGLVYLEAGQTQTGFAMLREAVDETSAISHPGVHADAGLALIAAGNPQKGLELLTAARQGFQQQADWQGVYQSLRNEWAYAQHTGRTDRAAELQRQLAAIPSP